MIDDNANLSLFEKDVAKNQVRQALQDALKKIDQAKTQDEIDRAKQEALSSMDQILAEAIAKANVRRLSSQDKDGSQTLASPSDTDQSGTSPVNPPAATRNRRTPPRRARRSVGFVGNSQTGTTPSAVDKSELRTLVEDLERRLQDLAGLSPEVLEEAQRILGEAQAALDNENLTAQELADLLAKVRQVLNSLQTGTSADKSQSASNLNKEAESTKGAKNETEVPLYGVLGAAVLSLLGVLLFALARKKGSQLDKLSRELHQLVVELEASNKDKKGLGKAKKLADEARLFVDSQQKDPQKEAELISEIKTVLSQLKEEV
ncbi:surface anchored protein [Streptococcus pneumoniae]|nr:surface anchored protein [Streptococcus pneumoniae]